MDTFQEFIAVSRYARWLENEKRRETWTETVDRYWKWMVSKFGELEERNDIKDMITNREVMPSMRALMTAGEPADRDNTCIYNCSYLEIDAPIAFTELMYILMNGTGVGYSVEKHAISQLPPVPNFISRDKNFTVVVEDSKEGWATGLKQLLEHLWVKGIHPTWDLTKIRPAGAKLKTFGGRASGPEPLEAVFKFIVKLFYNAQERRLTSLECHDICCVIARAIIVGGVRRSAMISLSDLSDREMSKCKSGAWWDSAGYRSLANNSAVYNGRPSLSEFLTEWQDLYDSHSGERGIFNRDGAKEQCEWLNRDKNINYGLNPCAEILLKPRQFCNLTEVIIKPNDKASDIKAKIEAATILGTCQSALTYFPFLSVEWESNVKEERLLGVSFTGIYDNPLMWGKDGLPNLSSRLSRWRDFARKTNAEWANRIGINASAAITCVKPSGTVSCLCDTSSGIHPRFSKHYIRRVRIDKKDPIFSLLKDRDFRYEDCVLNPASTAVFSFPMASPKYGKTSDEVTALEHLELWQIYKNHWCEHNPSITINYSDTEFLEIGNWVWKNFADIQGISFLPRVEHVYEQAPFEEIPEDYYNLLMQGAPVVDFNDLVSYELEDQTKASQTLACTGGSCEVVDLVENT
jgi:ribonucleoside-triphosphate reductase